MLTGFRDHVGVADTWLGLAKGVLPSPRAFRSAGSGNGGWPAVFESRFALLTFYLVELGLTCIPLDELYQGSDAYIALAVAATSIALDSFGEPVPQQCRAGLKMWTRDLLQPKEAERLPLLKKAIHTVWVRPPDHGWAVVKKWQRRSDRGLLGGPLPSAASARRAPEPKNNPQPAWSPATPWKRAQEPADSTPTPPSMTAATIKSGATQHICNIRDIATPARAECKASPRRWRRLVPEWDGYWHAYKAWCEFEVVDGSFTMFSVDGISNRIRVEAGRDPVQFRWPDGTVQQVTALLGDAVAWTTTNNVQYIWRREPSQARVRASPASGVSADCMEWKVGRSCLCA